MDWAEGIRRAIDYIEAHLTEEIDPAAVARCAACSSFYFQRIFTALCGMTMGEYIRARRLTLAGSELASTGARVIDVALKYGELLSRVFPLSRHRAVGGKAHGKQAQIPLPPDRANHTERRKHHGLPN